MFTGSNAWSTEVSLWYFSDKYAAKPSKHGRLNNTIVLNADNQLEHQCAKLPKLDKLTITIPQFMQCWQQIAGFLHAINHPNSTKTRFDWERLGAAQGSPQISPASGSTTSQLRLEQIGESPMVLTPLLSAPKQIGFL
ncbi:hypothetical protein BN14_11227 [Rhizoctonia solani AG-1 IB]|uniref:Uncharacterized protein n=1 Tax=Thanatephorus cucumeris (strain AG1-IB / isolate 7/3/14) TaxID=1108050 RepID=M5CCA4_THACB|nr:hypothetical protein BN14_11227 [Rhizoctonia solani AG-1 IB]